MINVPAPSANGPYIGNTDSTPYNQRIPDLCLPCDYPYVRFTQFRDGSWERQCEESGFESRSHGHISGSYHEVDYLGSHKSLEVGMRHTYTLGGKSTTVEQNHDEKIGGSQVGYISADHYSEHGGSHMSAMGSDTLHASGGEHFQYATAGTNIASTGDHVTDHNDGNEHVNIDGDHIRFTNGTKYDYIGGEHGVYVANGNSDTNVSGNCNIQSNSTITIKVGTSIIMVNGTSITITDSNNNQIGMTSSKMWVKPIDDNHPLYIGGPGNNPALYDLVATMSGPAINTYAKFTKGQE